MLAPNGVPDSLLLTGTVRQSEASRHLPIDYLRKGDYSAENVRERWSKPVAGTQVVKSPTPGLQTSSQYENGDLKDGWK